MNGSDACAFKITFVTKVSQEDSVHKIALSYRRKWFTA